MNSSRHYSDHFADPAVTAGYEKKFDNAVDKLRHKIECEILSHFALGSLYDCSIGTGRFVGRLAKVSRYSGMDYSRPFLDQVREQFPGIDVELGDLTKGISQVDDTFDTVLSLRTIFALGDPEPILAEMVRIAKPGGRIIFDYGVRHEHVQFGGHTIEVSPADIQSLFANLPVRVLHIEPLDALLLKMKRSRVGRVAARAALHSRAACAMLIRIEERAARLNADRRLYVLEKVWP